MSYWHRGLAEHEQELRNILKKNLSNNKVNNGGPIVFNALLKIKQGDNQVYCTQYNQFSLCSRNVFLMSPLNNVCLWGANGRNSMVGCFAFVKKIEG